jgi:hypothetical protein
MTPPLVGPFPPNSDLVAQAWLAQRAPGLVAGQIAAQLPAVESWLAEGFVTIASIPGTQPNIDVPIRRPIFQIDTWGAAGAQTAKPHWPKAYRLAELIRLATEAGQTYGNLVTLPDEYTDARVQAAYLISEPSRVPGDPSGYAHVTFDLALDWVPA